MSGKIRTSAMFFGLRGGHEYRVVHEGIEWDVVAVKSLGYDQTFQQATANVTLKRGDVVEDHEVFPQTYWDLA